MTKTRFVWLALMMPFTYLPHFNLPAQNTAWRDNFLVNVNRPFVYIKFDHIGSGAPRQEGDSAARIWLRFANNCRMPVTVHANGVPDDSPRNEVGVNYEVVPNRPVLEIIGTGAPLPGIDGKSSDDKREANPNADLMPSGTMSEVCSSVHVDPEDEILFSVPANSLGKKWHIEIPFQFDLPRGKGPRDPDNGGEPLMVVSYGLWDLPPRALQQLGIK